MRLMLSRRAAIWPFLTLATAVATAALLVPRTPQPLSYHQFADQRSWLGIPNLGNVASNIVFLVAGLWGLAFLASESSREQFLEPRERWPYFLVFLGLVLTAFGSAYYHLAPDNARLVWDRLPMTVVFMPLVGVLQWYSTEQQGAGDLRFYLAVQLYAVLALIVAMLLPPRYTRGSDLLVVAGLYVLAKICESADRQIFSLGHFVSGHTIKHLSAGAAGFWILRMLWKRQPVPQSLIEKTQS